MPRASSICGTVSFMSFIVNARVSDGKHLKMTFDLSLSESVGFRS